MQAHKTQNWPNQHWAKFDVKICWLHSCKTSGPFLLYILQFTFQKYPIFVEAQADLALQSKCYFFVVVWTSFHSSRLFANTKIEPISIRYKNNFVYFVSCVGGTSKWMQVHITPLIWLYSLLWFSRMNNRHHNFHQKISVNSWR